MTLFVSNKDESVRLFKNGFLEYFSHIHPTIPVIIFSPVICYFLYQGYVGLSFALFFPLVVFGFLSWLLIEYLMHRFVFHYKPASQRGKSFIFLIHGVHHDYPRDSTRLVMPLLVSIPLGFAFYFGFKFVFGAAYQPVYGGLVLGYLVYDCTHFACHHFAMKNRWLAMIKAHHLRHHYQDPEAGFGLSNPLWDYVFGTTYKEASFRRESVNEMQ